jgi:hypothetical protein
MRGGPPSEGICLMPRIPALESLVVYHTLPANWKSESHRGSLLALTTLKKLGKVQVV